MKTTRCQRNSLRGVLALLVLTGGESVPEADSQGKLMRPTEPANGAGVMVAGELWDTFLPQNAGPTYNESAQEILRIFVRMGNSDRRWTRPTHIWPGGWILTNYWLKGFLMAEWNPDSTFNPDSVAGTYNISFDEVSGPHYVLATFNNPAIGDRVVAGSDDPSRNFTRETRWVDANRHHALYEAGWPTNIGVDVKIKVHQWTLNWNNFNDFIIVEFQLTNTGNVDINLDGEIERTGNVIHALTLMAHGTFGCSFELSREGRKPATGNRFGAARVIGYVGDPDPGGSPWDIMVGFPGESVEGARDMGLNAYPRGWYTDVWSGWAWLGAKEGNDPLGPDKTTIFGTHPIGVGPERGWYTSAGDSKSLGMWAKYGPGPSKNVHTVSMGTWYAEGGRRRDQSKFDLAPNPKFFESGTPGNPETFVSKARPEKPDGDRKLLSDSTGAAAFEATPYEEGWNVGFSTHTNWDGDMYSAVGPFRLEVGETITIYWAECGGYRLQGVINAIQAARYTFENGLDPGVDYPAVPDMRIEDTRKTLKIRWNNAADTHPNFGGYKVYRASRARRIDFLEGGVRELDDYWMHDTPGPTPSDLLKPVNPSFTAQEVVAGKKGEPDSWGPYELVKVIPNSSLGQYAETVRGPDGNLYSYVWEDQQVNLGFHYWHYVAACTEGVTYDLGSTWTPYPGTNEATTSWVETSNVNRNGATGLWEGTYPFADFSPFFPTNQEGRRRIGAGFVAGSAASDPHSLNTGEIRVGVRPNPYKLRAFWDSITDPSDHKILFYNLPPRATITILDVAGQIIDRIDFDSGTQGTGSVNWDLFSRFGPEVASGLYIYIVEYEGGQQTGYFSVLR